MRVLGRLAVACAAAAAGAWALLHFAYRPHQCNAGITELTARTDAAGETADSYQRLLRARRNLGELAALRETCATSVHIPMLIGANEEITGQLEAAERSYRSALAVDRRPEIYQAIARVALSQGRIDDAVAAYAAAVRFAPPVIGEIESAHLRARVREAAGQAEEAGRKN